MAGSIHKTVCPHDCPDTCSISATVEEGRVTACDGDPDHPFTQGFLCHKVHRYPERIYSPDRILHPLRRVGKKGEGRFVRITWDEALDEVAGRLTAIAARWGSEAILPYSYGGNMGLVARKAGHAFFHRLGATRLLAEHLRHGRRGGLARDLRRLHRERLRGRRPFGPRDPLGDQRRPHQHPRDALRRRGPAPRRSSGRD